MRKYTIAFIIVVLVAIGVYDVFVISASGKQDSISWVIIEWSHEYPSFVFMIGFAMGHLFWRMKTPVVPEKENK